MFEPIMPNRDPIWTSALIAMYRATVLRISAAASNYDHAISADSAHEQPTEQILIAVVSPAQTSKAFYTELFLVLFVLRLDFLPLFIRNNSQFRCFDD
jgi:hypothetical protein